MSRADLSTPSELDKHVAVAFKLPQMNRESNPSRRFPIASLWKSALSILAFALISTGCSGDSNDKEMPVTLTDQFDETEMDAAITKARSSVDDFIEVLTANGADMFSVKAAIIDGDSVEHFWIVDVSYKDGIFSGLIGNDPGIVTNVKVDQPWQVAQGEISDWMYTKGDRIHGGFTIDPLLDSMPKERADEMRAKLVR